MSKLLIAALYVVTVDALGLTSPGMANSMAKRGEIVKGEVLGDEASIQRLLDLKAIVEHVPAAEPSAAPAGGQQVPTPSPEPEGPAARFALGLTLPADFPWTDEAKAYVMDLKEGVVPVPFDADRISDLTVKELSKRIEGVTGEAYDPGKKKKAEIVSDLKGFMEAYVAGLLADESDEEATPAEDELPENWDVEEKEDGKWNVIQIVDGERTIMKEGLASRDDAVAEITVLKGQENGGL